jgi:hypothetical protein
VRLPVDDDHNGRSGHDHHQFDDIDDHNNDHRRAVPVCVPDVLRQHRWRMYVHGLHRRRLQPVGAGVRANHHNYDRRSGDDNHDNHHARLQYDDNHNGGPRLYRRLRLGLDLHRRGIWLGEH